MLSPGELEMEVTLDKQLYQHGEKVAINLCIRNNSNKVVKKIKAMVQQGTLIKSRFWTLTDFLFLLC